MTLATDALDRMMHRAEEAGQSPDREPEETLTLTPTGVQVNKVSQLVSLYEAKTGEERHIPRLYVAAALKKRFNEPNDPEWHGKLVFSLQPTKPFVRGSYKCLLHPDLPERAKYDTWGLPVCKSAHIASPEEVRRHMAHKHRSEWAQIQHMQEQAEKEEDRRQAREMQAAMLAALKGPRRKRKAPEATAPTG